MTTNAIAGVGTTFGRELDTSSGVYAALAEVMSIDGPTMSRETYDVTTLDTVGGYREFIGGFRDPGEISLEMNFTAEGYGQQIIDFEAATAHGYNIVLSDTGASTLTFDGLVTDLPLSISPDAPVTQNITIKITGAVTFTS